MEILSNDGNEGSRITGYIRQDTKNISGGYEHLIMFRIKNYLYYFSRMYIVNFLNAWQAKFGKMLKG